MKELIPSLPPWKHMELLQRDKNIFCTHQGIVGIFINDNSYQYVSDTFLSTLHLSFCCWVCSNPPSWVLLLPPFANKEMDLSEAEQGPCVPAADGIASPSSAWLVAGTRRTSVHCTNGTWVLMPLLAQLHSQCVLSVVGVNGSLLDQVLHNARRHLSHCVWSTVNVNRSPVQWQPWWPRPKSAGKSEDLLCASKLLSTPFLWGTKKKSGKAWSQNQDGWLESPRWRNSPGCQFLH